MGADMCVSEREPAKAGRHTVKEHRQASKDAFIAAARQQLGSPERSRRGSGSRKRLPGSAAAGAVSGREGLAILGAARADEPAWVSAARAELTAACEEADAVAAMTAAAAAAEGSAAGSSIAGGEAAVKAYAGVLEKTEQLIGEHPEDLVELAALMKLKGRTQGKIGGVHVKNHEYARAVEMYRAAFETVQSVRADHVEVAAAAKNVASSAMLHGEYAEALAWFKASCEHLKKVKDDPTADAQKKAKAQKRFGQMRGQMKACKSHVEANRRVAEVTAERRKSLI